MISINSSSAGSDLRLDGDNEAPNEILEQGSHERPLVAQTYSAAVTKGKSRPLNRVIYFRLIYFVNCVKVKFSHIYVLLNFVVFFVVTCVSG